MFLAGQAFLKIIIFKPKIKKGIAIICSLAETLKYLCQERCIPRSFGTTKLGVARVDPVISIML